MIQQEILNQKELTVFINEELYENIYCEVFNKGFHLNGFVNSLLAKALHTYQVLGLHQYKSEGNVNIMKFNVKMDFTQGTELDYLIIADRLDMVDSFLQDVFNKRYLQYRRVSFTGSGPVMVPMGLSRIRMSLTSGLEKEHLDRTLEVLESTGKKLGI